MSFNLWEIIAYTREQNPMAQQFGLGRRKFLVYGSAALGTSLLIKGCAPATETGGGGQPTAAGGDTILKWGFCIL